MRRPLVWLVGIVALTATVPAAHAAYPGVNGKIAFVNGSNGSIGWQIYVMEPDGSGAGALAGSADDLSPAWSPDGTKLAVTRGGDVHVMNADGSGAVNLTAGSFGSDFDPTWSPDGTQIAFVSTRSGTAGQKIYKMDADGSDVVQVTNTAAADSEPAWSPDGQRIAFVSGNQIWTVKVDGTDTTLVASGRHPTWSPSGDRIAYWRTRSDGLHGVHVIRPDGTNDVDLTNSLPRAQDPAWSPDGTKIAVHLSHQIWTMSVDGSNATQLRNEGVNDMLPDWQPLPYPGYARPRGATPMSIPLVPAYLQCTAPDRTHGPPLAFRSCSGPDKISPNLTVGTPDANGAAANSVGSVHMRVAPGAPGPPSDTQVWISMEMTDVRCDAATTCGNANTAGGADYAGEVELRFTFQGTDKFNGPGNNEPATMTDYTFHMPEPCNQTGDPSIGSRCGRLNFSMDAIVPGIVLNLEGKRAVWQIGAIRVYDGGADADGDSTGDNVLFATQGLFVP